MEIERYTLERNGAFPNNENLPLVLYRNVIVDELNYDSKETLEKNGWTGTWTDDVFTYHHYHSVSHEVLVILEGSATLIFGGPGGKEADVKKGDAVVIPAGVGHFNKKSSSDFKVMGAYPGGQEDYDICTEKDDPKEKIKNIEKVPLPEYDPFEGAEGPLISYWK
ncbi:MAG: cupin domain-containing protein [Candidatus Cyclobacteriaceae bacterium M2_1C_046]